MYMDLKKWVEYRPQVPQDIDLFAGVEMPLSKAGLAAYRSGTLRSQGALSWTPD